MDEVIAFIKEKSPVYFLATCDGDQPRVRPFGTAENYNGKFCVLTGKNKDVYKQIMANPKVEISASTPTDWMRATGEMALDDSVEAKKFMLDCYPNLRAVYDENDDNTAVLYFTSAEATFDSLAGGGSHTVSW